MDFMKIAKIGKMMVSQDVRQELDEIQQAAEALDVTDQTVNVAIDKALSASKLLKKLEKTRKHSQAKESQFIKDVNAFFRPYIDRLKLIDEILRKKLIDWENVKRGIAIKAEADAKENQRTRQIEINKNTPEGETPAYAVEVIIPPPAKIKTAMGSADFKRKWKYEIIDEKLLDKSYMMLDDKRVKAAISNGVREIPGLKIYQKTEVALRGK